MGLALKFHPPIVIKSLFKLNYLFLCENIIESVFSLTDNTLHNRDIAVQQRCRKIKLARDVAFVQTSYFFGRY